MSSALTGPAQDRVRSRLPRFAEGAVERARLTVVPRRTARVTRVPFVVLVSLLLVGGVAGLLLFNTQMQQASFRATSLEEQAKVLDAREQSLKMQLERLRNPQRVAVQAREMGMVPPPTPAFLRISDGKVLGNPAPASPQDAIRIRPLPTRKPKSLRPDPVIAAVPESEKSGESERRGADREGRTGTPRERDERRSDRQQGGER